MTRLAARLRAFQLVPALALAALATIVVVAIGPRRTAPASPVAFDPARVVSSPPESSRAFASRLVGNLSNASVHHVEAHAGVKPHIHRVHEEVVVILEGSGTMTLGDSAYALTPGSTFLVPRGVVHAVESGAPLRAMSIFVPPFDGQDRVFVPLR
jgi:quercetin dioxygenase-like cupin family protein